MGGYSVAAQFIAFYMLPIVIFLSVDMEVIKIKNDPFTNKMTAPENKLLRPEIDYFKIVLKVSIFVIIVAMLFVSTHIVAYSTTSNINDVEKLLYIDIFTIFFLTFSALSICSRRILITIILLYQHYASAETRLKCCFTPSCSEYGIIALEKYGTIKGVVKIISRLKRCGYPGGIDYP